MDIFDTLTMLGGLALFLFGMSLMGRRLNGAPEESSAPCSTK